jgi:hypothetical protein
MESNTLVAPVTLAEAKVGAVGPVRTAELLRLATTASVRAYRLKGELEQDGRLYTLGSIREFAERRVRDGILPPDWLDAFQGVAAAVPA